MIRTALLAAASAVALGLAACDDNRAARVDAPEPAPLAELTAEAADLPFADPAPVEVYAPEEGYRWAERAYGLQRAVYDTPPDYGFAYDNIEPMVWETQDDWDLYAEPWDGGYRYYYYEPGAAYPYFVRDHEYGYAYSAAGVLIALFDSGGRYLPRETVYRYAPTAGRYYVRGRDLRNAGLQARRTRVSDEVWRVQAPRMVRDADPWLRAAREDRTWRAWRERDHDRELARFEGETRRRRAVEHTWREREDRLAKVERRDLNLERQAARHQQQQARAEQRRQEQAVQQQARGEQRRQAQAEQRRQQQAAQQEARAQRNRQAQQAQNEQRRQQHALAQQQHRAQQAQAEQRRHAQQAQAEEQRQQRAAQQQRARGEQNRRAQQQAQAEQRRQQQAQQRQARAQSEQRRQQQAQQQQQRQQQQAGGQARGADAQGQPAAARERGQGHSPGHGQGKGQGGGKKD